MRSPATETADYTKFIAIFLGFICFVVSVYIIMSLKEILVPVTVAGFLTLLFHPVVEHLHKFKIPKAASIILILLFIIGLYYLVLLLLLPEINRLPEKISEYTQQVLPSIQRIIGPFDISLEDVSDIIKIDLTKFRRENDVVENIIKTGISKESFISIPSLINDLLLVLLFWAFMIAGKKRFELRLQKAFSENRQSVMNTIRTIDSQMQVFILVETIIGMVFGIVVALTLYFLGIDFAITFGFLAFILNFIPKIGAIIGGALPVIILIILHGFSFKFILLFAILFVVVFLITNNVEPYFLGKYINLSPVFVLFSFIFWGWVWGIAGIYLAFPIAALMKIFFSNIEALRPLAIVLGSRVNLNKDALLSNNGIHKSAK